MRSRRRTITDKWTKTRIIKGSAALKAHIPDTRRLDRCAFERMLKRYGLVYVKPVNGSCGIGVMRAERRGSEGVAVQAGTRVARFATSGQAFRWIVRRKGKRPYLAQRGIRVIRISGRPVDFRVVIQRNRVRKWEVTGMLARVAHPRKAVTNGSQGGSIRSAREVLVSQAGRRQTERLIRGFARLARLTAKQFARSYPRMNELGLDIAVDGKLRSWILEVNTRPDPRPFVLLDDPSMLRRIVRLARGYGRICNLKVTKAKKG